MLRRGYDLYLHYANFGIRKIMIRLPQALPTPNARCAKYLDGENFVWQADAKGSAAILTISASTDSGVLDELWGVAEYLERIAGVRQQLIDT